MDFRRIALLTFILVLSLGSTLVLAQSRVSFDIIARDNGTEQDTVTIGFDKAATYCVDAALGEALLPPIPLAGIYDFRITDARGFNTDCLDQGVAVSYQNLTNLAETDTFQITLQPGGGGYPMHVTWPSGLNVQPYNSLHFKKVIGTFVIFDVDMFTNTTFDVSSGINDIWVIAGLNPAGVAERDGNGIPSEFALHQNYPNPFNPSTKIKFAIEKNTLTEVAVYDVLGRKVKSLVNENLTPGYYNAEWNGTDENGRSVGTGVYYVKMTAQSSDAAGRVDFSAVRKLLLMK